MTWRAERGVIAAALALGLSVAPACTCPPAGKRADDAPAPPSDTIAPPPRPADAPAWVGDISAAQPQPWKPAELFSVASADLPHEALRETLLLLCKVRALKPQDSFSKPDLTLHLSVSRAAGAFVEAPDDSWSAYAAARLKSLLEGDRVRIAAWERDATRNSKIDETQLVFDGKLPLRRRTSSIQIECRGIAGSRLQQLFEAQRRALEKSMAGALATFRPRPLSDDWGRPRTALPGLYRRVVGAAALVGWQRVEVKGLVGRLAKLEKRWREIATRSVSAEVERLPRPGSDVSLPLDKLVARVKTVRGCKKVTAESAERCEIVLAVKNKGVNPVSCSPVTGWVGSSIQRVHLIGSDGTWGPIKAACQRDTSIKPGQTAAVPFRPPKDSYRFLRLERPPLMYVADAAWKRVQLVRLR